jgi:HTH-type transcriptional regulator / antitoxin HigA
MKYQSIQEYLEKTGTTEKEFAEKIGVSQPFVSLLKNGTRRPNPELAEKIEAITGIPFRKLLLKKDDAATTV